MTFAELIPALTAGLAAAGVPASARWPAGAKRRLLSPAVAVGLRSCSAAGAGADSYLGESGSGGTLRENYGRRAELCFSLLFISPKETGPEGLASLAGGVASALGSLDAGFEAPALSCGDAAYDAELACFVRPAELRCSAELTVTAAAAGVFSEFIVTEASNG